MRWICSGGSGPTSRVVPFIAPWTAFKHKYRLLAWPWGEMFRLRKGLAAQRFDFGLSARWDPRDHLLLLLAGAKTRLGFPRLGSGIILTNRWRGRSRRRTDTRIGASWRGCLASTCLLARRWGCRTCVPMAKSWCTPARASRCASGRWNGIAGWSPGCARRIIACKSPAIRTSRAGGWQAGEKDCGHAADGHGAARAGGSRGRVHWQRFRARPPGRVLRGAHLHTLWPAIARVVCPAASEVEVARRQSLPVQALFGLLPVPSPLLHGEFGRRGSLRAGGVICSENPAPTGSMNCWPEQVLPGLCANRLGSTSTAVPLVVKCSRLS